MLRRRPASDRNPPRWFAALLVLATAAMPSAGGAAAARDATVGSQRFTESDVLGEIVRRTLADHGVVATHKAGLGNTGILVAALAAGEIDVYPEYTGTIA